MKKFFSSLNMSMLLLGLAQLAMPALYVAMVLLSNNVAFDWVTAGFIIVMELALLIYGWKPLIELRLAEFSFINCADSIRKLKRVSGGSGWREVVRLTDEIPSRYVRNRFAAFEREIAMQGPRRPDDDDFVYSDFQNYINEDILRKEVGNQPVSEALPGIMTGLGILGTFVGLVMGLQYFDSSTATAIQESIPTLINGIRTAFITSIVGIIFSLIYNMIYRRIMKGSLRAMDELVESVYGGVAAEPEEEARRILIEQSIKQTERLDAMSAAIGQEVSASLRQTVEPAMEEFSSIIQRLSRTADEVQLQALEYIVDNFVERMNQTMGLKLEQFGKTMQEVGYWQMKNAEQLQKTTEMISGTASDIAKLSAMNKEMLTQYESCARALGRLQGELSGTARLAEGKK